MTYYRDGSPAAVISFSFWMPGGADEALWQALPAGRDLATSVESDHALRHPSKTEPGTSYSRSGSIGDIAGFNAVFCGVSPRKTAQFLIDRPPTRENS